MYDDDDEKGRKEWKSKGRKAWSPPE